MNYSFEGIGQWNATFACGDVEEGMLAKIGDGASAVSAAADEDFMGMVVAMARDWEACTVQLGGMVTAAYTGTAPTIGWTNLVSDGFGGVKAGTGAHLRLVVYVDTDSKTVTFAL